MSNKRKDDLFFAAIMMSASLVQCCAMRYLLTLWKEPMQVTVSYLDPSTGAMIISAIVGIFATILLGVKTFWYKFATLFKKKDTTSGQSKESK